MHLDRAIDRVVEHLAAPELDDRDLLARAADEPSLSIFQAACSVISLQRVDLGRRVGDPVLDRLLAGERLAEHDAGHRPLAQHPERAVALTDPAHDVMDASWSETLLREHERLAFAAEQVLVGHADVGVQDLGVARRACPSGGRASSIVPMLRSTFTPGVLRGTTIIDMPLVRVDVRVRHGHDDEDVGGGAVGREPLVPVDDVLVADALGARGDHGRVGAGAGFGHREGGPDLSVQQRRQPLLLLLVVTGDRDELGVAGVRRVVPEHTRRVVALAEDLVHEAELHLAEALAPELRVEMRGPQSLRLHLVLQRDASRGAAARP